MIRSLPFEIWRQIAKAVDAPQWWRELDRVMIDLGSTCIFFNDISRKYRLEMINQSEKGYCKKRVRHLSFERPGLQSFVQSDFFQIYGNQITTINLDNRSDNACLLDHEIEKLAQHCPNLRSISLGNNNLITKAAFNSLANYCPNLSTLDLAHTRGTYITGDMLGPIVKNCVNLNTINLKLCDITRNAFAMITTHAKNLSYINLNGTSFLKDFFDSLYIFILNPEYVSDTDILALAQKCKKLIGIEVGDITQKTLLEVVQLCPKLKQIGINHGSYSDFSDSTKQLLHTKNITIYDCYRENRWKQDKPV